MKKMLKKPDLEKVKINLRPGQPAVYSIPPPAPVLGISHTRNDDTLVALFKSQVKWNEFSKEYNFNYLLPKADIVPLEKNRKNIIFFSQKLLRQDFTPK